MAANHQIKPTDLASESTLTNAIYFCSAQMLMLNLPYKGGEKAELT